MRPTPTIAIALIAAVMVTSCGVPVDGAPRRIVTDDIPLPKPTDSTPASGSVDITVYLTHANRLAPVHRRVVGASVDDRLKALMDGPTEAESSGGLRSAIGPDSVVAHRRTVAGVASVDLNPAFVGVAGEEQILAVAQVVFTATEAANVSLVQFSLDGKVVAVPTDDGTLSDAPIGRDGFRSLAPP